jgi:hypothetical protein
MMKLLKGFFGRKHKWVEDCGGGGSPPPPVTADPGKDMMSYLTAVTDPVLRGRLLQAESQDRPVYTQLGLADFQRQLFGMEGQAGGMELLGRMSRELSSIESESARAQRVADLQDVEQLGSRTVAAMRASDPQMQALIQQQEQMTNQLFAGAGGLSGQEYRRAQQMAREAAMSRGRGFDQSGMAAEVLGREEILQGKRAEAQQSGALLGNMYRQTGGDPFMAILGRPSQSFGALGGQQQLQYGMQQQGMGPQLFDPNVGVNIGMQNAANQSNYNAAIYGADQARRGAIIGGITSAIGTIGGAFAGKCWVARAVYGTEDGKWLVFRRWLLNKAPVWFRDLYIAHGEAFAAWVSNKPKLKAAIRWWMDGRIKTMEGL